MMTGNARQNEAGATPTFEEAYRRLEETVERLSAGGLPLEESLRLFEQGMALAHYCSTQLDQAELRVQQVGQLPPDELAALLDADSSPIGRAGGNAGNGGRAAAPEPPSGRNPALGGPQRRSGPAGSERPGPRDRRATSFDPLFDEDL